MNTNTELNFRDPSVVRKAGMSALKKELGTVGAVYFIRQFITGQGDYTAQRDVLLKGITLDEIIKNVQIIDSQQG